MREVRKFYIPKKFIHDERRVVTRYDSRYRSDLQVTGPVRCLAEAHDLLFRKWRVERVAEDRFEMVKHIRRRPLSLALYTALGQDTGIEHFNSLSAEDKKLQIRRDDMEDQRKAFMEKVNKGLKRDA